MVFLQLKLTKLKLEFLKSGFKHKKERYKHKRKNFCINRVRPFSNSAQVCFQNTTVSIFGMQNYEPYS